MGEDGEARDCDQRQVESFAEALGGAEAYADSGEGAGTVHDGYGVERWEGDVGARGEVLDGGHQPLGGGAAGEGCAGDNGGLAIRVGESNASGCAAGVDEQYLHSGLFSLGGAHRGRGTSSWAPCWG